MSILYKDHNVCVISHEQYIEKMYRNTKCLSDYIEFSFNKDLFNIKNPYIWDSQLHKYVNDIAIQSTKKQKKIRRKTLGDDSSAFKEMNNVKQKFFKIMQAENIKEHFNIASENSIDNNTAARSASKFHYDNIKSSSDVKSGKNVNSYPITVTIFGIEYLVPSMCQFFNGDVLEITNNIPDETKFNFIVLDPPWRNKYIRRKRKRNEDEGYRMMCDSEISSIPLQQLIAKDGLVAVWCTNSPSHINALISDIFPSWNVKYISTWFWIKVTKNGAPVCEFSNPPGKQPYERIIFGCHPQRNCSYKLPEDNKILISVPSAIHSHKPPLIDLINEYFTDTPKCLELFARYLLPGWTSCGDQVLSLQNMSLYSVKISDA